MAHSDMATPLGIRPTDPVAVGAAAGGRFAASRSRLQVRPGDLDSLGHANNARALEYLEAGRWDWLRGHGLRLRPEMAAMVVRVELDYLAQITWGEIEVETTLDLDASSAHRARLRQSIRRADGRLAVRGRIELVFVETGSGRLCTLDEFLALAAQPADAPV